MSAARAREIGLVSELVPQARLWDRAAELAEIIAAKPSAVVQGTVRAIWETHGLDREPDHGTQSDQPLLIGGEFNEVAIDEPAHHVHNQQDQQNPEYRLQHAVYCEALPASYQRSPVRIDFR